MTGENMSDWRQTNPNNRSNPSSMKTKPIIVKILTTLTTQLTLMTVKTLITQITLITINHPGNSSDSHTIESDTTLVIITLQSQNTLPK
jgi:hypothetical protein